MDELLVLQKVGLMALLKESQMDRQLDFLTVDVMGDLLVEQLENQKVLLMDSLKENWMDEL